jgi:hypothetical protein
VAIQVGTRIRAKALRSDYLRICARAARVARVILAPVMEDPASYNRYGWQSSLPAFTRSEPRVVRLQLERFVAVSTAR